MKRAFPASIWRAATPLSMLALAACAPAEEGGAADVEPPAASEGDGGAGDAAPSNDMAMAETGWLTVGKDGAVYTTFLDSGGTYRDFRNGEPQQTGTWERRENGSLCFLPEGALTTSGCWIIGKLGDDGSMRVTDQQDRTVEVKRVTYLAPEAVEAEADASASEAS